MKKLQRFCMLCQVYFPTQTSFKKHLKKCETWYMKRQLIPPRCIEDDTEMIPMIEKGKKSKYSFHCPYHPNRIISIG